MKIQSIGSGILPSNASSGADMVANALAPSEDLATRLLGNDKELGDEKSDIKEAFGDFVGQTFFGQLIASMRSTQNETPYFNGGRAEKIFQGQLDQVLAEELSDASAEKIADPMYKLFQMQRR